MFCFRTILSERYHKHEYYSKDFVAYFRLLLCYKHWIQLLENKKCEKEVTEIATTILPKDIPVYEPTSKPDITIQFRKILPKLKKNKMDDATKYV